MKYLHFPGLSLFKTQLYKYLASKSFVRNITGPLETRVTGIEGKIPSQASTTNQLADKAFVNSSISTNTGEFRGTYDSLQALKTAAWDANANDYGFVRSVDGQGNTVFDRYKFVPGVVRGNWVYEYTLNNSSFTAAQWEAINSGATEELVGKIGPLEEDVRSLDGHIDDVEYEVVQLGGRIDAERAHADSLIFDVTKENSGATFASLSALLSSPNLSTLIPTSVRTGGMTIRFAQSSDNKYVQARCMAQNFTTDVTQWQGVDDEPTVGSENLVKSGGVQAEIMDNLIHNTTSYAVDYSDIDNTTYNPQYFFGTINENRRTLVKVVSTVDVSIHTLMYSYGMASSERSDVILSNVTLKANMPVYVPIVTTHWQCAFVIRTDAAFVGTISIVAADLDAYKDTDIVNTEAQDVIDTHNVYSFTKQLSTTQNTTQVLSDACTKVGHTYLCEVTCNEPFVLNNLSLSTGVSSSTIVQTIGSFSAKNKLYIRYTIANECARMFFYNTGYASELNIRIVDISEYKDVSTILNAVNSLSDLTINYTDKSNELTWTEGYIRKQGDIVSGSAYAHAIFDVKKGDIIIGTYLNGLPLDRNYVFKVLHAGNSTYYIPEQNFFMLGVILYVAQEDATIGINKRVSTSAGVNISWYRSAMYSNIVRYNDMEYVRSHYAKDYPILRTLAYNSIYAGSLLEKKVSLLHFSDIHSGVRNMYNIMRFKQNDYFGLINDVICTGDMSASRYIDYLSDLWNSPDYNKMLLAIGNHDVYDAHGNAPSDDYANRLYWATAQEKYEQYIAPNVANWNVIQPADAATQYKCYYYKDYDTTIGSDSHTISALRLIVLDCMAFDATQLAWLVGVLEDARSNGYPVVIANHFVPAETQSPADYNGFDTPFNSLMTGMEGAAYGLSYLPGMCNAVDDFINAGGEFVCHICGHMHYDLVGTLVSHPNQIYIAIGRAALGDVWQDTVRTECSDTEDLFNVMSIDVHKKIISVVRFGADYDQWMRHRKYMTINYNTRKLLATW